MNVLSWAKTLSLKFEREWRERERRERERELGWLNEKKSKMKYI